MSFDMENLIQPNDFVRITDNTLRDEFDIVKDQVVFVAGLQAAPTNKDNPYLQQVFCLIHLLDDEDDVILDAGFFIVNPTILEKVSEKEQDKRIEQFKELVDRLKDEVVIQ